MPAGCDYHLFISKHEGGAKELAEVVGRVLRELGFEVWLSQFEAAAGKPVDEAAMQVTSSHGLSSKHMILITSDCRAPRSLSIEWL